MAVYFVQVAPDGPIKVGYADISVDARLSQLQVGCPYELRVIATIPIGTRATEAEIHDLFLHLAIGGEWFRPEKDLLEFIASSAVPWTKPIRLRGVFAVHQEFVPTLVRSEIDECFRMLREQGEVWLRLYIEGKSLQEIAVSQGLKPSDVLSEIKKAAREADRRLKRLDAIKDKTEAHLAARRELAEMAGGLFRRNSPDHRELPH